MQVRLEQSCRVDQGIPTKLVPSKIYQGTVFVNLDSELTILNRAQYSGPEIHRLCRHAYDSVCLSVYENNSSAAAGREKHRILSKQSVRSIIVLTTMLFLAQVGLWAIQVLKEQREILHILLSYMAVCDSALMLEIVIISR
jgi:hypothetical protein